MPRTVFFIRPSKELTAAAAEAVERFAKIAQTEVNVLKQTVNQTADAIESGMIDVIFSVTSMEQSEANVFMGCVERSKNPPYIIATPDNYDKYREVIPLDKLCKAKNEFTSDFIFTCLRNLLIPKNYRFDGRYFRSMLKSVIEVVNKNTGLTLQPSPITEVKIEESQENVVGVIAFYGDGIFGSMSINTSEAAVRTLSSKILYLPPEQVDAEIAIDLLAEFCNQIMGVMRMELRDFGWKLSSSLQSVHFGPTFLNKDTAPGLCYKLPFKLENEKFDIFFRYMTYQVSVQEIEISLDSRRGQVFDVRLVNLATDTFLAVLKASFGLEARRQLHQSFHSKPYSSQTQYIYHAGGWQGEFTLGLEMSYETMSLLAKRSKAPANEDAAGEIERQNRIFTALILRIGQEFIRIAKQMGYVFDQIYSGSVHSDHDVHHMLKSSGNFIQIPFALGASRVNLNFGLRSDYASQLFDAWPALSQRAQKAADKVV